MNEFQKKSLYGVLAVATLLGLAQAQAQRTTLTLAVVGPMTGDNAGQTHQEVT